MAKSTSQVIVDIFIGEKRIVRKWIDFTGVVGGRTRAEKRRLVVALAIEQTKAHDALHFPARREVAEYRVVTY